MKKLLHFIALLFILGCREQPQTDSYFTVGKASQYFRDIEQICNRDGGNLWGKNLFGPIMFVDRNSRRIIANQPDPQGLLRGKDGVYTGLYPKEQLIYTAPVNFGGASYAMVPLPAEEDTFRIRSRAIHVLFHIYQKSNGEEHVIFNQENLNENESRLLIKLEWKALKKAIESEGEERLMAIRDALVFRGAHRELNGKYTAEENRFEAYEGLATFTFTKLCTNSPEECRKRLLDYLDWIYNMPSYTRVYGSIHGALYASLLYDSGYDFRTLKMQSADLGNLVKEVYKTELPEICRDVAGSLAFSYDLASINREEEERLRIMKERLHKMTSIFTEKPAVYMDLESPYFDFEPEDVHPVDTLGTLYSSLRVSDNWGKLTVEKGGCLVSGNYGYLRLTARGFRAEKNRISGEGWNLILNDGWELVEVNENFFLRNMIPL